MAQTSFSLIPLDNKSSGNGGISYPANSDVKDIDTKALELVTGQLDHSVLNILKLTRLVQRAVGVKFAPGLALAHCFLSATITNQMPGESAHSFVVNAHNAGHDAVMTVYYSTSFQCMLCGILDPARSIGYYKDKYLPSPDIFVRNIPMEQAAAGMRTVKKRKAQHMAVDLEVVIEPCPEPTN